MKPKNILTVWTIAMINVAAICNMQSLALMAEYGLAALFFLILSSVFFLIPVSLVSAELASGWPDRGVYTWVKEGLNPCLGFLAVWLQWIQNVIWYPTILSFTAATASYIFMPELAANRLYLLTVVLSVFWIATFVNLFGMRISGRISTIFVIFGTILPVALLLIFGIIWLSRGLPVQVDFSFKAILPDCSSFNDLALLSGFVFSLTGLEMSAVHAKDAAHPKKDYPWAIFFATAMIVALAATGSAAVAIAVPRGSLELTSGGMEAFRTFLNVFGISWAVPIIAAVIAIGALGTLSAWIAGPSRGMLAMAENGDFPAIFQKTNKNSMPVAILMLQAVIVSILSLVFLLVPCVSESYWILLAMAAGLYMIMYILMFISAIRLRRLQPDVVRLYRIPGGAIGMWIVSGIGVLSSVFALSVSFLPPSQLAMGDIALHEAILIGGVAAFCVIPLFIYWIRKSGWKGRERTDRMATLSGNDIDG